jgi:hypothetical protein
MTIRYVNETEDEYWEVGDEDPTNTASKVRDAINGIDNDEAMWQRQQARQNPGFKSASLSSAAAVQIDDEKLWVQQQQRQKFGFKHATLTTAAAAAAAAPQQNDNNNKQKQEEKEFLKSNTENPSGIDLTDALHGITEYMWDKQQNPQKPRFKSGTGTGGINRYEVMTCPIPL